MTLIDTGSQVSTIAKWYYKYLSVKPLHSMENLSRVVGAGGQEVPFCGFIDIEVTFPKYDTGTDAAVTALVLVVPNNDYNKRVPVVIGTNVTKHYRDKCSEQYGEDFIGKIHTSRPCLSSRASQSMTKRIA